MNGVRLCQSISLLKSLEFHIWIKFDTKNIHISYSKPKFCMKIILELFCLVLVEKICVRACAQIYGFRSSVYILVFYSLFQPLFFASEQIKMFHFKLQCAKNCHKIFIMVKCVQEYFIINIFWDIHLFCISISLPFYYFLFFCKSQSIQNQNYKNEYRNWDWLLCWGAPGLAIYSICIATESR